LAASIGKNEAAKTLTRLRWQGFNKRQSITVLLRWIDLPDQSGPPNKS
jgi:hypothetical protein